MARCEVCFRHCEISEGGLGFCGGRGVRDGEVVPLNYGRLTAVALDPIEKKPLSHFYPGSMILSLGSYGCNLRCSFCQNHEISWSEEAMALGKPGSRGVEVYTPEEIADAADRCRPQGNIGVAFTYNEPLIGWEFVRDTAKLVKERGMKTVMVTNGTAELSVLEALMPYIDAMNIDLKGFTKDYYRNVCGGDLDMVLRFIEKAVTFCHVELTTLIVPGLNDSEEEMTALSEWVAGLKNVTEGTGADIPLHISRFFPRFHMQDRDATDVGLVYHLADVARKQLDHVYTGNC